MGIGDIKIYPKHVITEYKCGYEIPSPVSFPRLLLLLLLGAL